jgi:hypothetical protein
VPLLHENVDSEPLKFLGNCVKVALEDQFVTASALVLHDRQYENKLGNMTYGCLGAARAYFKMLYNF